ARPRPLRLRRDHVEGLSGGRGLHPLCDDDLRGALPRRRPVVYRDRPAHPGRTGALVSTLAAATRTGVVARRVSGVGRWMRANPVTAIGFAIIVGLILVAAFAPLLAPYGAYQLDPTNVLAPPSRSHLFGTGNFGEDIFSRVLFGARYDLLIGFSAVAIG